LAMAFKMINTLDSMVGYKSDRYRDFGWASARIDDAVNYLPARLSVAVIALATQLLTGGRGVQAWRTAIREGSHHTSPNAGFPEAAFAGALEIKLNGPNHYGGTLVEKPYIGVRFGKTAAHHIKMACDLMLLSTWIGTLAILLLQGFWIW
jgi:adenosylcobinamide-phosphate synthase